MTTRANANTLTALLFTLLAFCWSANSSGLISSNDGSHLALARALVLRGSTSIDPDRALTLEVDLAEREGHAYSDRPPGTAFAALPAAYLGDRLDPNMFERAMAQARAGEDVDPLPGAMPYITTYAARSAGGSPGPQLAKLIGTSIAISIHAVLVGLLGLLFIDRLLRRATELDASARLIALACLGLATAWGPYATALFSHVSAATAVAGFLLGVAALRRPERRRQQLVAALTGLAGAWAIACDYLLLLAIVPAAALTIPRRSWWAVALGATPIVIATLAYHHAAFGSPWSIGYDHQHNFEFARTRGSTFSGSVFDGLWTLWGLGRGAGLLAQAPIVLVGIAALIVLPLTQRRGRLRPDDRRDVLEAGALAPRSSAHDDVLAVSARVLLGFSPWMVALALHRTPWGGGTEDHRYLIPMLPLAGIGLAYGWARAKPSLRVAGVALALASAVLVWRHFLGWHDAEAFARPRLGGLFAAVILVISLAASTRPTAQKSA